MYYSFFCLRHIAFKAVFCSSVNSTRKFKAMVVFVKFSTAANAAVFILGVFFTVNLSVVYLFQDHITMRAQQP